MTQKLFLPLRTVKKNITMDFWQEKVTAVGYLVLPKSKPAHQQALSNKQQWRGPFGTSYSVNYKLRIAVLTRNRAFLKSLALWQSGSIPIAPLFHLGERCDTALKYTGIFLLYKRSKTNQRPKDRKERTVLPSTHVDSCCSGAFPQMTAQLSSPFSLRWIWWKPRLQVHKLALHTFSGKTSSELDVSFACGRTAGPGPMLQKALDGHTVIHLEQIQLLAELAGKPVPPQYCSGSQQHINNSPKPHIKWQGCPLLFSEA